MKRLLFTSISALVILVALAVMGSSLLNSAIEKTTQNKPSNVLGDEIELENSLDVELDGNDYRISWFVADIDNISLIPNFSDKDQANELVKKNNCIEAINAGFYDENDLPLGLFISDSEELHGFRGNRIMNAILSINRFDTPRITRETPSDPLVDAVQTGPILIENDEVLEVSITTDKNARRSVAAITGDNELYFLSIYVRNSSFRGPMMSEIPTLLTIFEQKTGINIADAVNMDGGSASYFKSLDTTLSEISPIGALFCVQ